MFDSWEPDEIAVLCFVRSEGSVLLIEKKRGFGAGKVNAPGGKVEPGETTLEAAVRETQEEVCVTAHDPRDHGVLRFQFADGYALEVHVFVAISYSGTLAETDEARPFWIPESEIPFDRMWEDDQRWLPAVLQGDRVDASMRFYGERMTHWDLRFTGKKL
jgi:8-oxo-dGTP diphosphatase